MRSTPGSRSAPRMVRIAASTWRLKSATGMKPSTERATMAWPVLVALPGSLTKSITSRPEAAPLSGPARSPMINHKPQPFVAPRAIGERPAGAADPPAHRHLLAALLLKPPLPEGRDRRRHVH